MALKVVPAEDERCDIHNRRNPPQYICETCVKELGVDPGEPTVGRPSLRSRLRRARRRLGRRTAVGDRRILIGGGIAAVIVAIGVIALGSGGGGGDEGAADTPGPPTEADVVNALELVPDSSGAGWITPDGACWIVSIQFGADVQPGEIGKGLVEATNEDATVGAAVSQNDFTVSEQQCVARIGAGLKASF
jgi:hypothetical protein